MARYWLDDISSATQCPYDHHPLKLIKYQRTGMAATSALTCDFCNGIYNVELYSKLVDLGAQAADLQIEVSKLKTENAELRRQKELSDRIIRHKEPVVTLKDDNPVIYYCSHCYDSEHLLIQLFCDEEDGKSYCPHCKTYGYFLPKKNVSPTSVEDEELASYLSFDPYNHQRL